MNQVDIILRFTARTDTLITSINEAGKKIDALNAQQRTANINNVLAQNKLGQAAKEVARIETEKLEKERQSVRINHNIALEKTNIRTLEKQIQNHLDGSVKLSAAKLALVQKELLDSKQVLKDEQLKLTQLSAQTQELNNQMKTAKQTAAERTKSASEFANAEKKATKAVEDQTKALQKNKEELAGIAEQANVHALQQARVVMDGVANGFARVTNEVVKVGNLFQSLRTRLLTSFGGDVQKTEETIAWIKQQAIATPFQVTEIMGSYTRLKMFAGSFKKDTKEMVTVVGDLATAFSQPLPRATQAVADAMNGMYVRLKNGFGITKQMIAEKAKEMTGETVINARGQITDMKAMNEALMAYIEESSKGAMQRMSGTYKIAVSNLQDAQEALADSLAQVVLPQFRDITLSVTNLVMALNKAPDSIKTFAGATLYSGYVMSQLGQKIFGVAGAAGSLIQAYTAITHAQVLAAQSGAVLTAQQSALMKFYTGITANLPFALGIAALAVVVGGIALAWSETAQKTEIANQAMMTLSAKKLHVTEEVKKLDKSVRDLKGSIDIVNETPIDIQTKGNLPQQTSDVGTNTQNVLDKMTNKNAKGTAWYDWFYQTSDEKDFTVDFSQLKKINTTKQKKNDVTTVTTTETPYSQKDLEKFKSVEFSGKTLYPYPEYTQTFTGGQRAKIGDTQATEALKAIRDEMDKITPRYTELENKKQKNIELSKEEAKEWENLNNKIDIGREYLTLLNKQAQETEKNKYEKRDLKTFGTLMLNYDKALEQSTGKSKDLFANAFKFGKESMTDFISSMLKTPVFSRTMLEDAKKLQVAVKGVLSEADVYGNQLEETAVGKARIRVLELRKMREYQPDAKDTSKSAIFSRKYQLSPEAEVEFNKLLDKEKKKLDAALDQSLSEFKARKMNLTTTADFDLYTSAAEKHYNTFHKLATITTEYKGTQENLSVVNQQIAGIEAERNALISEQAELLGKNLTQGQKYKDNQASLDKLNKDQNKLKDERNRLDEKANQLRKLGADDTTKSVELESKAYKIYINSISDGLTHFSKTHEAAYKQGQITSRQYYDAQKTYIDTHRKELEKVPEELAKAETKLNQLSQTSFQDFTKIQAEKLADGKITQADYYKAVEGYMHKYAGEFKDDAERRLAIEKSISDGMKKLAIDTYKVRLEMASKIASGGTNNFQSIKIEKQKAIFALQEEFKEYAKYETNKVKLARDYASRRWLLERDFARKEYDERIRLVKQEIDVKNQLLDLDLAQRQDVFQSWTPEDETQELLKQRDLLLDKLKATEQTGDALIAQLRAGQELDSYSLDIATNRIADLKTLDNIDDKLKDIISKERERAMTSYEQYVNSQKNLVAMGMNVNASQVSQNLVNTLRQALNPQTVAAYQNLMQTKIWDKMSPDEQSFSKQMEFYIGKATEIGMKMKNGVLDLSNLNEVLSKVSSELGIVSENTDTSSQNVSSMKAGLDASVKSANELANSFRTINTITAKTVDGLGNFMSVEEAFSGLMGGGLTDAQRAKNKQMLLGNSTPGSSGGGGTISNAPSKEDVKSMTKSVTSASEVMADSIKKVTNATREPVKVNISLTGNQTNTVQKPFWARMTQGFDNPVNDAMAVKAGYDTALQTINKSSQDLANYFKAGTVEAVAQYGSSLKTGSTGFVSSGMEVQSYTPYTIIEEGLSEAAKTLDAILTQAKLTTLNTEKSADLSSDLLLTFEDPKKPYGFLDNVNTNAIVSASTRKQTALDFHWEKVRMEKGDEELSREQSIYSAKEQAQKYLQGGIERVKVEEWFTKRRAEIDKAYAETMKSKNAEVYNASLARYTEMVEAQKAKDAEKAEAAKALEYAIAEANYRAYEIDYKNALEALDKQKKAYEALGLSRYQIDEWYQIQKKALEDKYIADKDEAETKRIADKEAKMQEQLDKEATFWSKEDEAKLNRIKERYDLEDELLRMLLDAEIISEDIYYAKRMASTKAMLEEYRKIGTVLQENAKQGQYLSDTGKNILATYQSLGKSVTDLQGQITNVQIATKIANDNAAQVQANYAEIEKNKSKLTTLNNAGANFGQQNQNVNTNIQGTTDEEILKEQTDILSKQTDAIKAQVEAISPLLQAQNEANMGRPTQATGGLSGIGVTVSGVGMNSATVSSGLGQAPQMPGAISDATGQKSSGITYTFKPLYGFDNPSNDRMAQEAGERFGTKLVAKSVEDFTNYFRTGMVSGVQTQNILVQKEGYNMANLQSKQTVTMPSGETKQFFSELKNGVAGLLGDIKNSLANAQGTYNAYIDNKSVKPNGDIKQNTRGLVNSVIASKYYGRSIL